MPDKHSYLWERARAIAKTEEEVAADRRELNRDVQTALFAASITLWKMTHSDESVSWYFQNKDGKKSKKYKTEAAALLSFESCEIEFM